MFETDEDLLHAAREAAENGYDIAQNFAATLTELAFETTRQSCGFVKLSYRDWATVGSADSKGLVAFASMGWEYTPGGINEAAAYHSRANHDIVDYVGDLLHGECFNARIQHDLSCSGTGCTWSEFNRSTAQLDASLGRQWLYRYLGAMLWWQIAMGRYHVMQKLCYAVRHCKIPEPTDCPWSGFPAHPVFFDIPSDTNPVSGVEVCRKPCIAFEDGPASPNDTPKLRALLEASFQYMYDPNVCYEFALVAADRLEEAIHYFPPMEAIEYCRSDMSWLWDGPVLSLYWKALGHMCGITAPQGLHDEKLCTFT